MTALTMPARPKHDAGLRPVPWRRMAWVTWRQHRAALAGAAVFLGALAVYLWLTGLQLHHSYAIACHPVSSLACAINFTGRWRWTLGKLVPLAVAVAAAAGAFSALFSWYNQPFSAAGYAVPLSARVFDLGEVAFTAWTLAAFAIGALAGMLIRRVVPAIAATLAVYAGLATALFLRQRNMTPLLTSKLNLPGSAWIVSQWYTKGGKFAFPARGTQLISALRHFCPSFSVPPAQCLSQHGYTWWARYQPGSRFWPFQWIEGGWLLALSVLLIATTVWLVCRRTA